MLGLSVTDLVRLELGAGSVQCGDRAALWVRPHSSWGPGSDVSDSGWALGCVLYHQPTDISSKSHPSSSAPDTPCPPPSHRMPSLPSSPTCMRGCGSLGHRRCFLGFGCQGGRGRRPRTIYSCRQWEAGLPRPKPPDFHCPIRPLTKHKLDRICRLLVILTILHMLLGA